MLVTKDKIQLIEGCFGPGIISASGKNFTVKCPACLSKNNFSKKKKLSICLESGIYHCWVCEEKGKNIGRLAKKYSNQMDASKNLFLCFQSHGELNDEVVVENKVSLPNDFKLLATNTSFKKPYKYLLDRGFKNSDFWKFKPGISQSKSLRGRIIFPSFDKYHNLNYYVARTYLDNNKKYFNSNTSRKNVIFNEYMLDFKKPLVLVEGIFDLTHCPNNATCILGSWIDVKYALFKKIIKNKTPVILCLDPDAADKSQKIAKALHEYCIDVKISTHNNKDFGSMTEKEVNYYIKTAKPFDNVNRISYLIQSIKSGSVF